MTTINLYQNPEEVGNKKTFFANNSGLVFSSVILLITILIIFILQFFVSKIDKENIALDQEIAQKNQELVGIASLQRILDLQSRIGQIKTNLAISGDKANVQQATEVLGYLENDVRPDVTISTFNLEGGKVKVSFVANSYNAASGQIFNFKKSLNFSDAALENTTRNEKNIRVDMLMTVKTQQDKQK